MHCHGHNMWLEDDNANKLVNKLLTRIVDIRTHSFMTVYFALLTL